MSSFSYPYHGNECEEAGSISYRECSAEIRRNYQCWIKLSFHFSPRPALLHWPGQVCCNNAGFKTTMTSESFICITLPATSQPPTYSHLILSISSQHNPLPTQVIFKCYSSPTDVSSVAMFSEFWTGLPFFPIESGIQL